MELKSTDLRWLRTLAVELRSVSSVSRGPRVFFDREWIDEVVVALKAITESEKGKSK